MQRVGFIGLGAMGLPMARHVMQAGFPLTVWARRPESAAAIRNEGAAWAESPSQLAHQSDVVITIITNSPDVREVVAGENGVLSGARDGLAIIDMSTIAPATSQDMERRSRELGVDFLDAPVSGGSQGAEAGTLTIMVGGDAAAFERVRPVLNSMGKNVFHVGPSGSGEIIKLVNNALAGVIAAATSEALVMGAKAGADVETMARVVGLSTGASWQLSNQIPLRAFTGTFHPGFTTDLLSKDLDLALDLGREQQTPILLTALARQLYLEAQAAGYGKEDYTSVLKVFEAASGAQVRTE